MTSDDKSGLPTTPPSVDSASSVPSGPQYLSGYGGPSQPLGGYTAADFPAPAGVARLAPQPVAASVAARPRRRLGALLAAASLSAVVGAGAGVGSYAYLTEGGLPGTASSISVTTVPASQTAVLDGTVVAAADAIQPSVVTITVTSPG